MSDFVLKHGNLDLFSAFKYENYLQFLKKSCKNDRFPLEDSYNPIMEKLDIQTQTITLTYPILKKKLSFETNLNNHLTETLFEQVILKEFTISSINMRDKYFMLQNHDIVEITKIIKYFNGQVRLEATKFKYSPMFDNPITSDITKIFYIEDIIPKTPTLIDLNSVQYKCFVTPVDIHKYIAIVLLHSL